MSDIFNPLCRICGQPPGINCRVHFVADLAAARAEIEQLRGELADLRARSVTATALEEAVLAWDAHRRIPLHRDPALIAALTASRAAKAAREGK